MNSCPEFLLTDKILIVAPHPDDESIGCGGLLALYGKQCDVLLLTDGRKGHSGKYDGQEDVLIKIREEELKNATKIANVQNLYMLHISDGDLYSNFALVKRFDIREYKYIFVPNQKESHEDHRVAFRMLKRMKRLQRAQATLVEYEVWSPLTKPTCFLDITPVIETKKMMISQHKSQLEDIDYVGKAIGLSCYRGIYKKVPYAEVYSVVGREKVVSKLSAKLPNVWKKRIKKILKKS